MKKEFIKIQEKRYRCTSIKRYEHSETNENVIHVYFSTRNSTDRAYHKFKTKKERDNFLDVLDMVFNVN